MQHTYEVNARALGDHAKAVRDALKQLGMRRCSLRLVYYQRAARATSLDWYGLFWRWLRALWLVHPQGAELLLDDLAARVANLRRRSEGAGGGEWGAQLARCEAAHSELIKAALINDTRLLRQRLGEDLSERRKLAALLADSDE